MRERRSVPHPTLEITIEQCGPEDLEPMLDRLETLLHEDYFFRRKHFEAVLARAAVAVYAVRVSGDFAAIAIMYNGSTLQNLYIHPEHRRLGVGTAVLSLLNPEVIRAKGNMSQGNPVPFYQQNGYQAVGADPHKPHIVLMEKQAQAPLLPSPLPIPGAVPAKKPISPEKRAHLDKIRAISQNRRRAAKAKADYDRLVAAGLNHDQAMRFAYGPAAFPTDQGAPTVGTLPD